MCLAQASAPAAAAARIGRSVLPSPLSDDAVAVAAATAATKWIDAAAATIEPKSAS
jgi:hypothetical protein